MNSDYYSSSNEEEEREVEMDDVGITEEESSEDTDTEFNQPPPGEHKYILYEPTFKQLMIMQAHTKQQKEDVHKKFLRKNWLTEDLSKEIYEAAPKEGDVTKSTGKRDKESFKLACLSMFPVGRIFSSCIQIQQVARNFLDQWAVSSTCTGKQIRCFFSNPPNRKKKKQEATKRISHDKKCGCPFAIRFQPVDVHYHDKQPASFYKVKVTSLNVKHTCKLSTISHRSALQSAGRLSIDISTVHTILLLFRENPCLSTHTLRPLLVKYLPHHKGVNSKYVDNFRKKAAKFLLERKNLKSISQEDVNYLTSNKKLCAADEIIDVDDDIVTLNLKALFRKIIQEKSDIWSGLRFLQQQQRELNGFVFSVKNDDKGKPCGIMYMTPRMRQNLIRFGDVMYLDAQQRQFNNTGFPYISPCMTNEEGKIAQGAEALVIEESIDMYTWILEQMSILEPRFQLSKIRFIFADQKITNRLLSQLNINLTCTLRCDSWHLMNEVWPKHNNFGNEFQRIKGYLRGMLESHTKEQWDDCFQNATQIVSDKHSMVKKLSDIHDNPTFYAGYYLNEIKEGSLGKKGDSHSEQNHASIISYLGEGGNLELTEQITQLLERHKNRVKLKTAFDGDLQLIVSKYRSRLEGYEGIADNQARMALSDYAYTSFFLPTLRKSSRYQVQKEQLIERNNDNDYCENSESDEDETNYVFKVFPCYARSYDDTAEKDRYQFTNKERCQCYRRRVYLIMCEHEFAVHKKYMQEFYDSRWLNVETYCTDIYNLRNKNMFNSYQIEKDTKKHTIVNTVHNNDETNSLDDDSSYDPPVMNVNIHDEEMEIGENLEQKMPAVPNFYYTVKIH